MFKIFMNPLSFSSFHINIILHVILSFFSISVKNYVFEWISGSINVLMRRRKVIKCFYNFLNIWIIFRIIKCLWLGFTLEAQFVLHPITFCMTRINSFIYSETVRIQYSSAVLLLLHFVFTRNLKISFCLRIRYENSWKEFIKLMKNITNNFFGINIDFLWPISFYYFISKRL